MRSGCMLLLFLLVGTLSVSAHICSHDSTVLTGPGMYPKDMINGKEALLYDHSEEIRVGFDTMFGATFGLIDYQQVDTVFGLPPGISYGCDFQLCRIPSGAIGCVFFTGTPPVGSAGAYPIHFVLTTVGYVGPALLTRTDTVFVDTMHVLAAPPIESKFSYGAACENSAVPFTNESSAWALSYLWDFGDNSTSNAESPNHIFPDTGSYLVQLAVFDGLNWDTSAQWIKVNPSPEVTLPNDTTICVGATLPIEPLSVSGAGLSFLWLPANRVSNDTSPQTILTPNGTTNYTLEVTDSLGCRNSDQIQVVVDVCTGLSDLWRSAMSWSYSSQSLYVQNLSSEPVQIRFLNLIGQEINTSIDLAANRSIQLNLAEMTPGIALVVAQQKGDRSIIRIPLY